VDPGTIAAAVGGAKHAIDLIRLAVEQRDELKAKEATRDANDRLLDIQQACLSLVGENAQLMKRNTDLENEVSKLKDFHTDIANYRLHQTVRGGICYRPKPDMPEAKMAVYLCANCAAKGVKTYLQPVGGGFSFQCAAGHGEIPSDKPEPYGTTQADTDFNPFDR